MIPGSIGSTPEAGQFTAPNAESVETKKDKIDQNHPTLEQPIDIKYKI